MAELRYRHEIGLSDPADQIAELAREVATLQPPVLIYACSCQAPIDFPDRCPVHGAPVQNMVRTLCCED